VRPLLINLFSDPAILRVPFFVHAWLGRIIAYAHTKVATANYTILGGSSPLLGLTEEQARSLEAASPEFKSLSQTSLGEVSLQAPLSGHPKSLDAPGSAKYDCGRSVIPDKPGSALIESVRVSLQASLYHDAAGGSNEADPRPSWPAWGIKHPGRSEPHLGPMTSMTALGFGRCP
jgi:Ferrochelatase